MNIYCLYVAFRCDKTLNVNAYVKSTFVFLDVSQNPSPEGLVLFGMNESLLMWTRRKNRDCRTIIDWWLVIRAHLTTHFIAWALYLKANYNSCQTHIFWQSKTVPEGSTSEGSLKKFWQQGFLRAKGNIIKVWSSLMLSSWIKSTCYSSHIYHLSTIKYFRSQAVDNTSR